MARLATEAVDSPTARHDGVILAGDAPGEGAERMNCQECKDEVPMGAQFCINCGAPVAATGRTQRLQTQRFDSEPYTGGSAFPLNYSPDCGGTAIWRVRENGFVTTEHTCVVEGQK